MIASLAVNMIALRNPKSPIRTKPLADGIVALALLAVMAYRFVRTPTPVIAVFFLDASLIFLLIFSWDSLLSNGYLGAEGAMLTAYAISPMIVNLYVAVDYTPFVLLAAAAAGALAPYIIN